MVRREKDVVMKMSLLCRGGFYECGHDDVIAIVQAGVVMMMSGVGSKV